jgi:hypothetical protein
MMGGGVVPDLARWVLHEGFRPLEAELGHDEGAMAAGCVQPTCEVHPGRERVDVQGVRVHVRRRGREKGRQAYVTTVQLGLP